jgi:hypothetical protein
MEVIMQETTRPGAGRKFPASPVPFMPFLDLAAIGVETQLKAWQAYQIEGARFVANRMHANLECLRALGGCTNAPAMTECCRDWLETARKEYTEEWGRLLGTASALGFADMAAFGQMCGKKTRVPTPADEPARHPQVSSRLQAAA